MTCLKLSGVEDFRHIQEAALYSETWIVSTWSRALSPSEQLTFPGTSESNLCHVNELFAESANTTHVISM